jgi:hypothetical protein
MTSENPDRSFTVGIALESPSVCAAELRISLARFERGQRALQAAQPSWQELTSQDSPNPSWVAANYLLGTEQAIDAQAVLRGIRNVLRLLEKRIEGGEGGPQLRKAEAEFRESFPSAWNLRDILEHLPEYAAGEGRLQEQGEVQSQGVVPNLVYQSVQDPLSEVLLVIDLQKQKITLKAAARKAIEIAELLAKIDDPDAS